MFKLSNLIVLAIIIVIMPYVISCGADYSKSSEDEITDSMVQKEGYLKLAGIKVNEHKISGNVMNKTMPDKMGALVYLFIKNTDLSDTTTISKAEFNNENLSDLKKKSIISWADSPGFSKISGKDVLPEQITVITINIIDEDFYSDGLKITLYSPSDEILLDETISIRNDLIYFDRINFTKESDKHMPSISNIFIRNKSSDDIKIKDLKFWKYGENSSFDSLIQDDSKKEIDYFSTEIESDGISGAKVKFYEPLPMQEVIVEMQYEESGENKSIFAKVKAYVSEFDIAAGWVGSVIDIPQVHKTLAGLHINTIKSDKGILNKDKELYKLYPMKAMDNLSSIFYNNQPSNLPLMHGIEVLGEVQYNPYRSEDDPAKDPQGVFEYTLDYKKAFYPFTLTLSDEPWFFQWAGVVEFPHFNQYRVIAPRADDWNQYEDRWNMVSYSKEYMPESLRERFGENGIRWAAPLETIGDMVRTLNTLNRPFMISCWSQGLHDWNGYGVRKDLANPLEMHIQNIQAIANGAAGIYWFNMGGQTLGKYRDELTETRNQGRIMKLLGSYLIESVPFYYERTDGFLDKNLSAGNDFVVAFVTDLNYKIDPSVNAFEFTSGETVNFSETFKIPDYLKDEKLKAVKVDSKGVYDINISTKDYFIKIEDDINISGIYVISSNEERIDYLKKYYLQIIEFENSIGFNPIENDEDFESLRDSLVDMAE